MYAVWKMTVSKTIITLEVTDMTVLAFSRKRQRTARMLMIIILCLSPFIGLPEAAGQNNQQLLPRTVRNLEILADTTQDFALPGGCLLSGTVVDSEDEPVFGGTVTAAAGDQSYTGTIRFTPFPLPPAARYQIVLPAGTYALSATVPIFDDETESISTVTHKLFDALTVTCNTTRNLRLPAPPRTFLVQGTITSVGTLPRKGLVTFFSEDGRVTAVQPEADGSYRLKVPAGRYWVTMGVMPKPAANLEELLNINLASVAVTGDQTLDLTLPATVNLEGKITDPSGNGAVPSTLIATDAGEAAPPANRTNAILSLSDRVRTGDYRMFLPPGTYDLFVSFEIKLNGNEAALALPIPPRRKTLTGDSREDFVRPAPGATVTLSGKVTDSSGRPVANATVTVIGTELVNLSATTFSSSTETKADGTYSLKVLPGRNYTVTATP